MIAAVAEWQTHTTQNRAGNHVGSSPTSGTIIEDALVLPKHLQLFLMNLYWHFLQVISIFPFPRGTRKRVLHFGHT